MKAELKNFFSSDIDNLKEYRPRDSESFGIWIRMLVGEKGKKGEESFDVLVCTPKWLETNRDKEDVFFGYHHLFVFEYDYDRIYQKVERFINSLEGNNWQEIANKISKVGYWEFEDYKKFD